MNVVFRADASSIIGIGHIMRCLTLAHLLSKKGAQITFISRLHSGHLNEYIAKFNYHLIYLPKPTLYIDQQNTNSWLGETSYKDACECIESIKNTKNLPSIDWLVIDHYAIEHTWQKALRPYCDKIMVIDDLANRSHDCDLLLDQTLNCNTESYQTLVPKNCKLLLGQTFMLIREQFFNHRSKAILHRKKRLNAQSLTLLIAMGGSDPDNISSLAIKALHNLKNAGVNLKATVVLSSNAYHLRSVYKLIQKNSWLTLEIDTPDMPKLMLEADLAIGASGSTAWERCCLGLPCISVICADNQIAITQSLSKEKAIVNLGFHHQVTDLMITSAILNLLSNPKQYQQMVKDCFNVCNGLGTNNTVKEMMNYV